MALTYTQFKDFIKRTVWRDGDTVLDSDLDNLINMAHAKLNRELRVNNMVTVTTDSIEAETLAVPTDFLELRSMMATSLAYQLTYITPHEMQTQRLKTQSAMAPFYSIAGSNFLFAGPMSASDAEPLQIIYYAEVPDYAVADASWLETDYLDVYTYAVLSEAGMYLREDARLPTWTNLYSMARDSANNAEIARKYAGSPLQPALPSGIA